MSPLLYDRNRLDLFLILIILIFNYRLLHLCDLLQLLLSLFQVQLGSVAPLRNKYLVINLGVGWYGFEVRQFDLFMVSILGGRVGNLQGL